MIEPIRLGFGGKRNILIVRKKAFTYHPVQWIRIGRVTVTNSSSFLAYSSALLLVSINANPQNCAPVQLTTFPSMKPGLT